MSSPDPHSEDELNHLVRGALKARVSGKTPPDRVWKQIKLELETGQSPPEHQSRVAWSPLAVQAALTLVLVMLGGFGLRTLLGPVGFQNSFRDVSPSGTMAFVEEQSVPQSVATFDDKAELRSLKADLGSRSAEAQPGGVQNNRSPVVIPRDVPLNVFFSEGHKLSPEPSLSLIVSEQNPIRSGPYPWYR
jgi:hypothetical protein